MHLAVLTPAKFDILFSRIRHLGGTAKAGPSDVSIRCTGPRRQIIMTYPDRYTVFTATGEEVVADEDVFLKPDQSVTSKVEIQILPTDWNQVVGDLENRMGPHH